MTLRTPMRTRRNRAFTLIELMVVVLILAVLAALVVPKIVGAGDKAKYGATQAEVGNIKSMLEHFRLDCGRYPTTEEGLGALRTQPAGLEGKWGPDAYSSKDISLDPYGNPYHYESPSNTTFTLSSYAQDGAEGGDGYNTDITETD